MRRRVEELGADRIAYVVDARQSLHFEQVFALARAAGWLPEEVQVEHVAFGTVLGENRKPFKTREGQAVSLTSLLDEAEEAAGAVCGYAEEKPGQGTSAQIGIGAVKYADLSSNLVKDYTFSLARMTELEGNTGPYLQYAHARVCALLEKAGTAPRTLKDIESDGEARLALLISQFPEVVEEVCETLRPHHLCGYLMRLAAEFSSFYEQCPVLKSEGETKQTRLALCVATKEILGAGLGILGITAPQRMPTRAQTKEQSKTPTRNANFSA